MMWLSVSELEEEGPPSRNVMVWVMIAVPIILTQISVFLYRLVQSLNGHPLEISERLGIVAHIDGPAWAYVTAALFYTVLIALFMVLLWGCALNFQSWLYWRRKRKSNKFE
ncbi:MAG: hypothetical protein SFV20_13890 [Sphingopyxis sp.]|nr:hypothetical protein [Sphingopyxis sp.]